MTTYSSLLSYIKEHVSWKQLNVCQSSHMFDILVLLILGMLIDMSVWLSSKHNYDYRCGHSYLRFSFSCSEGLFPCIFLTASPYFSLQKKMKVASSHRPRKTILHPWPYNSSKVLDRSLDSRLELVLTFQCLRSQIYWRWVTWMSTL